MWHVGECGYVVELTILCAVKLDRVEGALLVLLVLVQDGRYV